MKNIAFRDDLDLDKEGGRNSKGGVTRHPPGSQMILPYISLVNQLKMEKLVKG